MEIGVSCFSKKDSIVRTLVDEIVSGKYDPLGLFPSEHQLVIRFKSSRTTVRSAVQVLEEKGFVYRRQGAGTFVYGLHQRGRIRIGTLFSGGRYSEIFPRIEREIVRAAQVDGLEVVCADASMINYDSVGRKAVELARNLVKKDVKGVVFQPVEFSADRSRANAEILDVFAQAKVPVVLVDCDAELPSGWSNLDLVSLDNFAAGRDLAMHLRERRVQRVSFVARSGCADSVWQRLSGVSSIFGVESVDCLFVPDCSNVAGLCDALSSLSKLDAVVCQNDVAAVNVAKALGRKGMQIPRDVMLAGFDDVSLASAMKPGLTTVRQPYEQIARIAYLRLRERMSGSTDPVVATALHGTLVVRGTTEIYR